MARAPLAQRQPRKSLPGHFRWLGYSDHARPPHGAGWRLVCHAPARAAGSQQTPARQSKGAVEAKLWGRARLPTSQPARRDWRARFPRLTWGRTVATAGARAPWPTSCSLATSSSSFVFLTRTWTAGRVRTRLCCRSSRPELRLGGLPLLGGPWQPCRARRGAGRDPVWGILREALAGLAAQGLGVSGLGLGLSLLCASRPKAAQPAAWGPLRSPHPPVSACSVRCADSAEVAYALTAIVGIGRRLSFLILKKAGISPNLRAGQLSAEQIEKVVAILSNPLDYKIPEWFLNRQKDFVDGKSFQVYSNNLSTKLRDDLERMKKMRLHRGVRHYWGLKVRGQRTCTTGRGDTKLMHH